MLKTSRININPPDGHGSEINSVEISIYDTDKKSKKEYRRFFACGQYWSRGDKQTYKIIRMYVLMKRKGTEIRAVLYSVDTPQKIEASLITLINFWTQLDSVLKSDIIESDKRFEVLD